jgi:hypothetical protein
MSSLEPETLQTIKELMGYNDELQKLRDQEKVIDAKREECRLRLFEKFGGNVIIQTPVGNINIYERTIQGKLSLEDIRMTLDKLTYITSNQKERLLQSFSEQCGENSKTSRTLTVSRKMSGSGIGGGKRERDRRKNKTIKHPPLLTDTSSNII